MKKISKQVYCSRCGDEIPQEERALLKGSMCALCDHMQFEAQQIWHDRRKKSNRANIIFPAKFNPQ